ncbi:hypothetical protein MMC13_007638 [Lambiella insularis]|nr:hypothetical protein [Lambiella insularis]
MPVAKDTIAARYERKIREEKDYQEAEASRNRLEREQKLKRDVGDISGLRTSANVMMDEKEYFHRDPVALRTRSELEAHDTIYQVPWSRPAVPGQPRAPQSPQSSSATSSSVFEVPYDEKHLPKEIENVRRLEEELDRARRDLRRLDQEIAEKNARIIRLQEQRDSTDRLLLQARMTSDQQDGRIARLERQLEGLRRQLENAQEDRTQADAALRKSRSEESALMHALENARKGNRVLLDDDSTSGKESRKRPGSRARDRKVLRRVSTRRSGPNTMIKTKEEYEFTSEPEAGCACLVM